jgi:hypothetical protein
LAATNTPALTKTTIKTSAARLIKLLPDRRGGSSTPRMLKTSAVLPEDVPLYNEGRALLFMVMMDLFRVKAARSK